MGTLIQDLRYGFRMLLKRPAFSVVAIVVIALGIGVNTAIFSLVDAALLRSLPFEDPDRLVMLWETYSPEGYRTVDVSPSNFIDWKSQSQSFESLAAFYSGSLNLVASNGSERVPGAFVSATFFDVLGTRFNSGRGFSQGDDQPGRDNVVVLSHSLWQRGFGGDHDIIDRKVTLNGKSYTVIGVAPAGFQFPDVFPERSDLWVPLAFTPSQMAKRDNHSITVIARLKPGLPITQAQAEMDTIARALGDQYPDTNKEWGVNVVSLHEQLVGDIKLAVIVLMGAVGFVLLIACANVANLLLTRAMERRREIAVRTALGAGRGRLIQQMLTESILLSAVGGAIGLFLAYWLIHLLIALLPIELPSFLNIYIDIRVLIFTLVASILTGVIFGLAPAIQISMSSLIEELKGSGPRASKGSHRSRVLGALAVAEVALALVLLVCAGLLVRSFIRILNADAGFRANRVMTMAVSLPASKYSTTEQQAAFFEELLAKTRNLPGVERAAAISTLSLTGVNTGAKFSVEDRPRLSAGELPVANRRRISSEYFSTMAIPVMRGRPFTDRDRSGAPMVVIINQSLAQRFWPDQDPIGKRLTMTDEEAPREIVGVVGDEKRAGLDAAPGSEIYVPFLQQPSQFMTLVVKTPSDSRQTVSAIRSDLNSIDKELALYGVKPMEQVVADSVAPQRFSVLLITGFALLALALATIGIYGVMAYSISQRTREIGIRIALGATQGNIIGLVMIYGLRLTLIGLTIGLAGTFALTQVISSLLYGISATDPVTYLAVSLLIGLVALSASVIPAWRATRVNPITALRAE